MTDAFMNMFGDHDDDQRTVMEFNNPLGWTSGEVPKRSEADPLSRLYLTKCKTEQLSGKQAASLLRGDMMCFVQANEDTSTNIKFKLEGSGDDKQCWDKTDGVYEIHQSFVKDSGSPESVLYLLLKDVCQTETTTSVAIELADIVAEKISFADIICTLLILVSENIHPVINIVVHETTVPHFSYRYAMRQLCRNSTCDPFTAQLLFERLRNVQRFIKILKK